jgi:L,D-transpeptidase catalytic domain
VPLALIGIGIAALLGAAALVGATRFGSGDERSERGLADERTRDFIRERGGAVSSPLPSDPKTTPCYSTAYIRRATTLYRAPGGRRRIKLTARTEWGSPRVLGVVKERRGWLGVQASELSNGEIAWIRKSLARLDCSRWSLHVDLSKRRIVVREDGKTVRKVTVAVGRPDNPTPVGRFTVTDKLRVTDQSSPYGCCVLALTGHQTNLPLGWPGGDRLAVHATGDDSSIGQPSSSGCMRARPGQARWLIHTIPLGAPIFIRA